VTDTLRPPIRAEATGNTEFWGSRDQQFIDINSRVQKELVTIAGGNDEEHVCVPVQGSGTFAIEATLGTLVPDNGKLLVLVNGAYGTRMLKIAEYARREHVDLSTPEDTPPSPEAVDAVLKADADITHVAVVHCETTSGILNPIQEIAQVVRGHDRRLIVDAMSSFGAIPVSVTQLDCDALVASSNKCLQGVPGVGYAIMKKSALAQCEGNAHALSLDLYDQHRAMAANGQWRFTPPTHVLASFDQAIREHGEEGGVEGRHKRYSENCHVLIRGMRKLGFEPLLPDELQAPIIVTFHLPDTKAFVFDEFYDRLAERGYLIYPGKLTVAPSFRIGCIGQLYREDIEGALAEIAEVLDQMGVNLQAA